MTAVLRLGTRASVLAVTQSRLVADAVARETGATVELVTITTHGDVATGSLASLGGTGVFATALREALLAGECDLVVHSLKDLPTAPHPGLVLAAIPERAPANDVLCGPAVLADLPRGARVGTGSPRRAAQVRRRRPDLAVLDIRGNVDTRLRRVDEGDYDAIVLAAAGLRRIGREAAIREELALSAWPTSAGQGALAVEIRETDAELAADLRRIADPATEVAVLFERAVLAGLEAGCAAPVGISATTSGDGARVDLVAEAYAPDGTDSVRVERSAPAGGLADPAVRAARADAVVRALLDGGAAALAGLGARP